jgi:acyl-CoA synthetase (AMP-forming)/AMP-acid ligase II
MTMPSLSPRAAPRALSGPDLVAWLGTASGVRERVLADGGQELTYAAAVAALDGLDDLFARAGASPHRPVAVECSQSVNGALALLHLLSRGYSAVLLPELGEPAKESGTPRFIPSFCSHVVTARAAAEGPPAAGIAVAANTDHAAAPAAAAAGPAAIYLRTSGSTGVPKLARMSHQRWLDNAQACVERWSLTGGDRLSVPVPIFHSYGFGAAFLPGLLAGAAMDVGSGGNLLRYLEREQRFAPDVAFLTPALCDAFVNVRKGERRYRLVVTAGDKIKRETMAAFEARFGPLLNLYGSAEMGAVSAAAPSDPYELRHATAGHPLAGIELSIDDSGDAGGEAGNPGDPGDPGGHRAAAGGERSGPLLCRQRNGLEGYLIGGDGWRFEARAGDSWFATGDLARLRADGYVEILGRSGLSVKRDGLLVVFADVEAAVERVEGVERAVVVGAGETGRGTRLVAICLPRRPGPGGTAPDPEAVRRRCFDLLPRYAVPDQVIMVGELPHLPSGKVDRRALRELAARS